MSYVYLLICITAGLFICDDMALGHVHPVKGAFVMLALVWNTAYTIYKNERKVKR